MDPKSTPSHGKCIPLPTHFEESVVGNFHSIEGLENRDIGLESNNYHIWYAMCFLKVKDGHLTILIDCPFPSFWPELPNCEEAKSMMVCFNIKIYRKLILRKRKRMQERSLKQSLLWAQVSQLTFIYLLRLAITPYCP